MKNLVIILFLGLGVNVHAQVAINNNGSAPDNSAMLDVNSDTKGMLMPRMTTAERNAIAGPAVGLLVFDIDKRTIYMYDGNRWQPLLFTSTENNLPPALVTANDGTSYDYLGSSVCISGDYAIAGAYTADLGGNTDQGCAYIFHRTGGLWTQQAKLTSSDGASFDYFGCSVGISGDYAVVGAYLDDVGANGNQGSAYVFYRTGTTWTQQAQLTSSDGQPGDYFGNSVSISGDNVIVGAYMDDVSFSTDQGSAYIFSRSGSSWSQQAQLYYNFGWPYDYFGCSVSISGNYAVAGAYGWDRNGAGIDEGAAFVFYYNGTSWGYQYQLFALMSNYDYYGSSVSISGDYAIVGAPGDDISANVDQGGVYVFHRTGTTWSQQAMITAADGAPYDKFGSCLGIGGDYIIAGANLDDVGAIPDQGSSYLFKRNGSSWYIIRKIDDPNGQGNGYFGTSVSIDGFNLVNGAYGKNNYQGEVSFLNFQ